MSDLQAENRVTVGPVRFEHLRETLGIGAARPRLSWIANNAADDWRQSAYALQAYAANGELRAETQRIESSESVLVEWPFAPLAAREQCSVRVRVWGADGSVSAWSDLASAEVGLLDPSDWSARFVGPDWDEDTTRSQPCPMLRNEFDLRGAIAQARLYITSLGVYAAEINGAAVGDQVMPPGWTSYGHRLRYQTYDVAELLHEGRNAIGAMLGEGWFRGRLGYHLGQRNIYGDRLALLAQLEVIYADGSSERFVSDESWRAALGPVVNSEIYDGETYDPRREAAGWSSAGFDDSAWSSVRAIPWDMATLVAPLGPPVRRIETVAPQAVITSPSGKTILDFGQNLVGWLRLTVQGPAGQTITLRHAEVLEDGEVCMRPLRYALATDHYTLRGGEVETWEPRFTFHGFRYAEVSGWPGELAPDAISAIVCHSDMERTGWFECSDPLVNRLHENVLWSMRGNFFDVPTDCPQRDERLGWTGDIQVFAPTASFLYDVSGFLESWLADLAAEQAAAGGIVPFFVPNVMDPPESPAAAWGDAAAIVPWVLYQRYGDKAILAKQFDSMRAWVDCLAETAGPSRLWEQGMQFGDWLDPKAPPDNAADARTAPYIVATAYFARSAELVGQVAEVLGRSDDAETYRALAAEVREAFAQSYITPAGRLLSDATTAYAMAIEFALLPSAEQRQKAGARLVQLVRGSGYHISTGFVGTPLVCDALCDVGEYEAAYRLLMQQTCPSWLYPVTMGATTIWERWDSMLPSGEINPGEMTSFNHYALGAVADWLHRIVAGLAPAEPGYRQITIKPNPGGGLTHASARHRTPYGLAACAWKIADGAITVEAEIPANTTAVVHLPGQEGEPLEVGSGSFAWTIPWNPVVVTYPPITLDSTLGEVIDQAEYYEALMDTFKQHNSEFITRLGGQTDITLRQAIRQNVNSLVLEKQIRIVLGETAA